MSRGGGYRSGGHQNKKQHDGGFRGGGRHGGRGGERNGQGWGQQWNQEPPKPKPVEMDTDPTPIIASDGTQYPNPLPLKVAQALRALRTPDAVDPQTRPILESWEKRVEAAIQCKTTIPEPPNWQAAVSRTGGWGTATTTDQNAFLMMAQATTNKKGKVANKKTKDENKKAQVNKQDLNRTHEELKEKLEDVQRDVQRVLQKVQQRDMVIADLERFLRQPNMQPMTRIMPVGSIQQAQMGMPAGIPQQGGKEGLPQGPRDGQGYEAPVLLLPTGRPPPGLVVGGGNVMMPPKASGAPVAAGQPAQAMHN